MRSQLQFAEGKLFVIAHRSRNHIELYMIDLVLPSIEEQLLPAPISELNYAQLCGREEIILT